MAVEKESTIEDIMEGSTTEDVTSDTKVSLAGEEIPEELEVEKATIEDDLLAEESIPTPSEPKTEPQETGVELTPIEQEFIKRGLDKQFKSVEDMMSRVPEMNKYINDLSVNNKRLQALEKQAPPKREPEPMPSSDEFFNSPVEIIEKMIARKQNDVIEKQNEMSARFDKMEKDAFIASKADFKELVPLIEEVLAENEWLLDVGGVKAIKAVYQMAKAEQLSRVPTPVRTVPNKASAETSVGKKSTPIVKDKSYYNNLTPKQIEEELGVTPKYYD